MENLYEDMLVKMAREVHEMYPDISISVILVYILRSYNLGYTLGHVDGYKCKDTYKVVKIELE